VVAGVLGLCAGPAGAATVEVERMFDKASWTADRIKLRAAFGERNDVTLSGSLAAAVTVTDRVPLDPGPGCEAQSAFSVVCRPTHMFTLGLDARLGDRDDKLTAAALDVFPATLVGGRGDDRLVGPVNGATFFSGGPGDDVMRGGSQADTFFEDARRNGSDTMPGGRQATRARCCRRTWSITASAASRSPCTWTAGATTASAASATASVPTSSR
jgi:hypothetical protein